MKTDHKDPKEYFLNKLEEQVKELEEEIEELGTRLEDSDWDPKIDYEKQVDDLRIRLGEIRERMEELNSVAESEWKESYKEVETDLASLADSVQVVSDTLDGILLE